MKYTIEVLERSAWLGFRRRWWSRIKHANGNVLWTSQMYTSKRARDDTVRELAAETDWPVESVSN
jgi:hypothetical protein